MLSSGRIPAPGRRCRAGLLFALTVATAGAVHAQIPQDRYLRYVPLRYPRIVRQTEASVRFALFGDPADPAFRDEAPRDGVDDTRAAWLTRLAVRFAPIMVRNSEQFPFDFRAFYDRGPFPIFVERWDIARASFALMGSEQVDMAKTLDAPCAAPGMGTGDDCRLLDLLSRYGPDRRPLEPEAVAPAEREVFSILHYDLPGHDEKTWKREYGKDMRAKYGPAARVFAHPFVTEIPGANGGPAAFEFVIQYWFFYPSNDGPNNHEGDWEHINVVVSPLSAVATPLPLERMQQLVSGAIAPDGPDPLVMRRIEYYLHHFVVSMDFAKPNAYQPRAAWEREVRELGHGPGENTRIWRRTRERAWQDAAETTINTRPVVWIGGDGIGVQNVLQAPGLRDQDGHASYPFPGYYKRIGPGSVSERVIRHFDPREYFATPGKKPPYVEDYGDPVKVALMPDWERVLPPIREDARTRRDWAWLVLPLRFGYPATVSPGAGLARHADMGNVSVVGPAYNDGWNRTGDSAGYDSYELLETTWATPLGVNDSFFPRLGFLNAPILYFMIKPPLDLAWRTAALPVRAVLGSRQPTFLPKNVPAVRTVSVEAGPMLTQMRQDFVALFFTREQLPEIIGTIAALLPPGATPEITGRFDWAAAPAYSIVFHLTPRFSAESAFVDYSARVGFDVAAPQLRAPIETRGTLHQREYHGTMRYNLRTGAFQPYVKYGHGLTSFRLENVRVNGTALTHPDSPRFKPQAGWRSLGFNETILGGGVDWNQLRLGSRTWVGVKASYTVIHHDLGFERDAAVEDFGSLAADVAGTRYSVWRQQLRLLLSVGF